METGELGSHSMTALLLVVLELKGGVGHVTILHRKMMVFLAQDPTQDLLFALRDLVQVSNASIDLSLRQTDYN